MSARTVDSVFDEDKYLEVNRDVRVAIERNEIGGAAEHYYKYGAGEGREAFWKIIGQDRAYQCDAILIDGAVDVVGQYWALREQNRLDVHFHIISDDPDKFNIPKDGINVTLIWLTGRPSHHVVHDLVPSLRSDFIIFSVPYLFTDLDYVRSQINRLQNSGREVLIRVGFNLGNLVIIRKNTFLDMGGFRDISFYYLEDLIYRAKVEERPSDYGEILKSAHDDHPSENTKPLRHHAIGYAQKNVEADIILPFHGQLEFVEESIQSVLDQENANVVIHLVDDCSREDTSSFLRRWKSHKNIRVYRNSINIGQFITVNNIVPFLETDYMVIQDGDDISASNRIFEGVNLLELTKSDLFGSRMLMFGDEYLWDPDSVFQRNWIKRRHRYWNAIFPHEICHHYFPHCSVIMTKKSFMDIGGYTDYGDAIRNKTTNDTELLYRYFFSGHKICYSVSHLVHYRRHLGSVTQSNETGWTTPARIWGWKEVDRRRKLFFEGRRFISNSFGSIDGSPWSKHTQLWEG